MCWGDNYYGDVGDGTSFELRLTPVAVVGISEPIVEISTGGHHSCVLLDSGTVKCWGWNTSGQLGIGVQSEMVPTPQDVVLASSKPTPTPTASPTPCPPSTCPLDFSLNVESYPPFGYSCDTSGGSTTCSAPIGSALHASVILTGLGGVVAYDAAAVMLTYTGLGSKDNPNSVWPGCVLEASSPGAGFVHTGCAIGISQPSVAFVGEMATADFQCAANGNLTLVHGPADTLLIDNIGQTVYESGANETLTIQCASPQAYPGDTDGDTCPDANETGVNPLTGGLRNFVNPWDYFNPTHDGENRIDDVLVVRDQYYIDQGDLGYTADTDRTFFGPNEWDLGAPDGLQRVDDILNIVKHYFHDCS